MGNNNCYGYTTTFPIPPTAAVTMYIYRSGSGNGGTQWTGSAWVGQWVNLFTNQSMPFNGGANLISAGQFVSSRLNDFTSVKSPMNFVHKVYLKYDGSNNQIPWDDTALPAHLQGKSQVITIPSWPFNIMDIVGTDYTSMSSEIN